MDGFLISLAQEVHAALRARDVLVERKYDVVGSNGVCGRKEAEYGLERLALVVREGVLAPPLLNVALHGDFCREPMIRISYRVRIPRECVAHRIELHHISISAVDDFALVDIDGARSFVDRHVLRILCFARFADSHCFSGSYFREECSVHAWDSGLYGRCGGDYSSCGSG